MNEAVRARLEELRALSDGWFNGDGVAPGGDLLKWMVGTFAATYPASLPPCEILPIVEGGLRVNWFGPAGALAADVYRHLGKQARMYGVTVFHPDRVLVIGTVDLSGGWRRAFSFVPFVCFRGGQFP